MKGSIVVLGTRVVAIDLQPWITGDVGRLH
jgi:hypothetical protein